MSTCTPFLLVANVSGTISWYEGLGFTCAATNRIWEHDCEINWARIEWDGAGFMIGIDERAGESIRKDSSIWFNVEEVETILKNLLQKNIETEIEEKTFYGRKVVSFSDCNGFSVSFSCPAK